MKRILCCLLGVGLAWPALAADGFTSLFNGRDLAGWDGKPEWWRVEDGAITAESTAEQPCTKHNYLIWRGGEPSDFELRFEYRLIGGNSGVQIRSREVPDWDMRGYQADIEDGAQWTGALFEHERGGIALRGEKAVIAPEGTRQVTRFADAAELQKRFRSNDWNDYRVTARGPEIQLFINGVKTAHAVDRQSGKAASRGLIGLQMHPGPPMKVQFRNLRLREFAPTAGATPPEKLTVPPGFKAELLYSPAKENEGSWVSLCTDAKGRFIASGQYDEGLFRITPPPIGGDPTATQVEKIPVELSSAQGLCWAFDSLYALVTKNARTPSGLYRVRDSDGDDQLDQIELLRALEGGGDHGWHAVSLGPDGKSLCVVAGNNTTPPKLASSRVPPHWSEDHLLPRLPDAGGHMKGVLAPGGVIYRVSPDGRDWEMIGHGFRNPYDAAFNRAGELFTYDADMEWDLGTPWYRPTRICHVTSGAEFGWRNGTGKWPAHQPDSLAGILDIGPGSPTGLTFGYGTQFPTKYREALFAADWTFGRIYAVHLQSNGASYRGESELFVSGVPLPVVDLVVHPTDGALYFITGGWRIQTGLYRVTYAGQDADEPSSIADTATALPSVREQLESFHGRRDPAALQAAWPYLGHEDRFLSFAARVALEWQDPGTWREKALAEKHPATALNALLALLRVSAKDKFHRKPADVAPDAGLQARVLEALERFDWSNLSRADRIGLLRAYTLCFTRLGPPDQTNRARILARVHPWFPATDRALNSELCSVLVYLQSPRVAASALQLVRSAPTQEEQLDYIKSLRMLRAGWTPELREEYFAWFNRAAGYRGGSSFAGFLKMIKADALTMLTDPERFALKNVLDVSPPTSPIAAFSIALAGRTNATEWTMAKLSPLLERGLPGRDLERGRRMFGATGCFQCHHFAGEGGAVGPDLTQVAGRFSPRDLLEAIIEPSKTVSDLFANALITLRDGESLTGRIVYHLHDDSVMVSSDMFNPAQSVKVDRKDILSIEPSRLSPMPDGLLSSLTQEEVLDLLAYLIAAGRAESAPRAQWPQFRGLSGSGIGASDFPAHFGPNSNAVWKTPLPSGHSSPCIAEGRIFLTGFTGRKLETICLSQRDGAVLWRRQIEPGNIERGSQLSNPASATPATDGQRVYVYFGAFGLVSYDFDGKELWRKPLAIPVTQHGAGTSPVLAKELLILNCDQDVGSYLLAVNKRDGLTVWKTHRPGFHRGFATPLLWPAEKPQQIIVPGTLRLVSYNLSDGTERWSVRGLPNEMVSSPVAGEGLIYIAGWTHGSGVSRMPAFDKLLEQGDTNHDGQLTREETPPGPPRQHFLYIDADKNGRVTREEYTSIARVFDESRNVALAIRPDGRGEVTDTHVVWRATRGLPYVPSPLYYEDRIYLVKNGGLASCFDAATGRVFYQEERLGALGDYYSSPVAAAGKICVASQSGVVVVYRAGGTLEVLARNALNEPIIATPAVVEGTLYVRTASQLYAFRAAQTASEPPNVLHHSSTSPLAP